MHFNNNKEDPAEVLYLGETLEIPRGTPISELMMQHQKPGDGEVLAARMNNRIVSLTSPIVRSGEIEPIKYNSPDGARIYRRHLTMMLYEVFYERYHGCHIKVGQAVSEGVYFEVTGANVDKTLIENLTKDLKALAGQKRPFHFRRVPVEEARRLFDNKGTPFKKQILDTWPSGHVGIMSVGNFLDFALGPIAPHTGFFEAFNLFSLNGDLVLQFPDPKIPELIRNETPQPKLYETLKESKRWSGLLGVAHVGDLNSKCIDGTIRDVVKVAEGLHEKKISGIADAIAASKRRLVLIAGPSSAGKTTFTKRISIQLMVSGIKPMSISLDNYYVDREKTPKHANGEYDFETLEAIDIELFNDHLRKILDGELVRTPRYNFNTGKRVPKKKWLPVQMGGDNVLIIEGIHGLNDALTHSVSADNKYRIYVNALNPLAVDEHNRLHTSDARLIRRIVRDRHYRGYSAAETINRWQSVRKGERKHIFPFQELADVIFDSSLIYEFSVLKVFAERYLLEVPRTDPAFSEAYRLRKFLSIFVPILPGDIPQISLVREFIGGSGFSY